MHPMVIHGIELIGLTAGYWILDTLIRRDGYRKILGFLGIRREAPIWISWLLLCAAVAPFTGWQDMDGGASLRLLATALVAILAWQAATKDVDVVVGDTQSAARILILFVAIGTWFSPAFLLGAAYLLTTPFRLWQHHATLPMRLILGIGAYAALSLSWGAATGSPPGGLPTLCFFLLTMIVSHYFITALAKTLLGPKWYSWVSDNKLHHMAASAYSWGWARFLPWATWMKVILAARKVEKPMQAAAYGIEMLAPLALLSREAAILFCLGWAAFHLGVFSLSGLLFWDWILADLAFAFFLYTLPPEADAAFGPIPMLVSLCFMAAFPLRHKLWKPMPLGWFDTPFTQRIHWRVRGESGKLYGLYNDYMCPHERLYGKVHGCFLVPTPVVTYHLGECWKHELRDALRAAGPDPAALEAVKERFGITPTSETRAASHKAYLQAFFHALNRGARKHVLPRALRFLKAPGDQLFYWGELPPFRGQENVRHVTLIYREEYFDGKALQRIREDVVLEFDVPEGEPPVAAPEPTPKEIDDFLMTFAAGKLIDLPGYKSYLDGDDGKSPNPSPKPKLEPSAAKDEGPASG